MLNRIFNILNNQLYPLSLYARRLGGTIVLFLIARYLTVYDYGLFSSYGNIAGYIFALANLNYHDYILVSSNAEQSKVRQKTALFILHAILLTFAFIGISIFCNLENHLLFILVLARIFFDTVFFTLILPYFQATKKFTTIAWINIFYAIGVSIIAIISFFLKLSLIKFLILNIILGFINFIQCSHYININYFGVIIKIKKYISLIDKKILGYMISAILGILYVPIPALFVATFIDKEQAALFFAASTIASIAALFITAQTQKITPELVKADINDVKKIMKKYLKLILLITGAMLLFMIFCGKFVLVLFFGKQYYENAHIILLLLMLGNIIYGVTSSYGTNITASGNQAATIPMRIEFIAVTIISLFALSKYGIYGAAISNLITMIYMLVRYKVFSDNWLKKIYTKGG